MNKLLIIGAFAIMVLAQWFVPAKMILDQETVLNSGTAYKFKTVPLDPNDPLRGKYISLRYEMNKAALVGNQDVDWDDPIFVYIKKDTEGFAVATKASATKLNTDQDYVLAKAQNKYADTVRFMLPFTRFYMEESKAYPAEILVRQANRDSLLANCYGLVYIKDDTAVLDDVFVNNKPIKEYVEAELKKNAGD
ncbi:GDYXXLXY domain-containing protein [Rasiella rasia]|uniref:GDYXXLXY domain-containing protein n=1 Tax=Rasiella rasia TaxID=2744027 RepID=A0A6G6GRF3_9FLAO|nr:GDYXXLXY domain-containing protein [Rasiella rasia]QIE60291.1 GDYXXLXY domain-containing protein [Rasiella rasia]